MEVKSKLTSLARKGNAKQLKKFIADTNPKAIQQRINESIDDTGASTIIACVKVAGANPCQPGDGFGMCCRLFTKCGSNINYRDHSYRTCLHWAVINKNTSLATILVGLGGDCRSRDKNGLNPFHLAVKAGNSECVVNMLQLQPEIVNILDASGVPPIIMSLQKGHYDMCRLLIKGGADINLQEKRSQRSAVYYAVFLKQFTLFEEMLGEANLDLSDHRLTTIIHRCCAVPDASYLAAIFKSHPTVPISLLNMEDAEGATAAITACQNGHYEHLQILVDRGASVSTRDKCKRTVLHHCADNLDTHCVELLLRIDPSLLNIEDHEGLTPLHLAVITGNIPLIRLLLKRGADLTCQDFEKHTVAHWATVRGLSEVLTILLEYGADILTPDAHNAYPLHYAAQVVSTDPEQATSEDGTDVLRMLLEHDSPLNAADDDGRTPLLWAACSGNAEACRVFVDAGADVDAIDVHGLTALHCAASRGHLSTVQCLIKECNMKVDVVDTNHCTALFYAITLGNIDCMKVLIELGANLSHLDTRGRTPAHCGAVKGSVDVLKLLHRRNVDLWKPSIKKDLPLHEAATAGHVDVVDFLLKNKPKNYSVDVINQAGRSCLYIAASTNNVWLCKYLIDAGANINLIMKTKGQYYTPYDGATINKNEESAEYIKSKGGRRGDAITQNAARIIQRNLRSKYGRPKTAKPKRTKSQSLLNTRERKRSVSPYNRERRASFRPDDSGSDRGSQDRRRPSRLTVTSPDRRSSTDSSIKDMGTSASKPKEKQQVQSTSTPSSPIPPPSPSGGKSSPSPERTQHRTRSAVKSAKDDEKSRQCNSDSVKQTNQKSKLVEEIQASVRRFESERKYIRELHQMRRAKLYMGPLCDVGLYRHMSNDAYRPKTAPNSAKEEKGSLHSLSEWDEFVQDQCKFVSHIHEDKKPSYRRVRSAAEHQHRKLQDEAKTSKRATDNNCERLEKQAQEKEARQEAQKKERQRRLDSITKRTTELFNEANGKANQSLQTARKNNEDEYERIENQKPKPPKSPRPQTTTTEETQVANCEDEEKERRETYRQWQKRKAEELRKRLDLAYRRYLPPNLFPEKKQTLDVKPSSGRPTTAYSYNTMKSRPTSTFSKRSQREITTIMTLYGSRRIPKKDRQNETKQASSNGTGRSREPLIFLPPDEYEVRDRERKQKEREYLQQRQHQRQQQRPVESCA